MSTTYTRKTPLTNNEYVLGRSKVDRFKWSTQDQPGTIMMIDKKVLSIDTDYQRTQVYDKVNRIASNFSWMAFGALTVAYRGGSYYITDGGHRWLAAMKRSDISLIPVVVFETSGQPEEAGAFVRGNTERKSVYATEKFKAQSMTGDPAATLVQELISQSGLRVTRTGEDPNTIRCIAAAMAHAKNSPENLKRCWPLIARVCHNNSLHKFVLESILYAEQKLNKHGGSLLVTPWVERVEKLGRDGIIAGANEAARFYKKGGSRVWAEGLVAALNRGLRKKLSLSGVKEED